MHHHPTLSSLRSSAHRPPSMAPTFGSLLDQSPAKSFGDSSSCLALSFLQLWSTIALRSGRNTQSWPMFVKHQLKKLTCLHWRSVQWMIIGTLLHSRLLIFKRVKSWYSLTFQIWIHRRTTEWRRRRFQSDWRNSFKHRWYFTSWETVNAIVA